MLRRAALLAVLVAGCYQPTITDGLPCGDGNACPDGQTCFPTTNTCLADPPPHATFTSISAGLNHTCGLDAAHHLWCWGDNGSGELGLDDTAPRATATQVGTATWTAIAAGDMYGNGFTCGIQMDHTLWCWGNQNGAMTPTEVDPGHWVTIGAGNGGWCASDATRGVFCQASGTPWTQVSSVLDATLLTTDGGHSCLLDANGLSCWGDNTRGQLGNGTTDPVTGTFTVPPPRNSTTWTDVSAGSSNTCGVLSDHSVWCWGASDGNQNGPAGETAQPGLASDTHPFVQVSSLDGHTCATDSNHVAYCWGYDDDSELGDGARLGTSDVHTVLGTPQFQTVVTGDLHTCGLDVDGGAWCWGDDSRGQLGDGQLGRLSTPTQVRPDKHWSSVVVGPHQSCAIDSDAGLWCWGSNGEGELGDGTTTQRVEPTQVPGSWLAIGTGDYHSCGIKTDHSLWCWGLNQVHSLGLDDSANRDAPEHVGNGIHWTSVVVADLVSCALDDANHVSCWGGYARGNTPTAVDNASWTALAASEPGDTDVYAIKGGQLYDIDFGNADPPILVPQLLVSDWTMAANQGYHGCGVRADSSLWCFGYNSYGSLGSGDNMDHPEGVAVTSPQSGWTAVAVGGGHACGVTGGNLYCWGDNELGQLGLLGIDGIGTPTHVAGTWVSVSAAESSTCAIDSTGGLYCWGVDRTYGGGWATPVWVTATPASTSGT